MNYDKVIGLEVHLQPTTKSKMFCTCSSDYFGKAPNTLTCPVCLGLPGALPVPNKVAIERCIKLGLALDCEINHKSKFDRKNYFYPDLPKGYQISQYDLPFCFKGYLEVDNDKDTHRIRITRIHLEEDTAKSIHEEQETLIDFNKSGMPLIEIVTEPDFQNTTEVLNFAKRLRQIVRYLDISTANMEKGQMRFELNMSLKPSGSKALPNYKVEVKNIASISVLEKVIDFEFARQSEILDKGDTPAQETRGLRDLSGKTYSQRVKEGSEDYRYFPEPDIPEIEIDQNWLDQVSQTLVELPQEKKERYMADFGLEPSTAETIVLSKSRAEWFESAISSDVDKKVVHEYANWFVRDVLSFAKVEKLKLQELKVKPEQLLILVVKIHEGKLSGSLAKQVLTELFENGGNTEDIIKAKGLSVISDESELKVVIDKVIQSSPDVVENIKKNPNATKFLFGQVMAQTRGKADPKITQRLLDDAIAKIS